MKKTKVLMCAAAVAFSGIAAAMPAELFPAVTADAAESSAVLDAETGTLTLSGTVAAADVQAFAEDTRVKAVVCAEGTVLPENCCKMFMNIQAERIDLSGADTSAVTDMSYMFSKCSKMKALNLSGFTTANVTTMKRMFHECSALEELDLSSFNTAKVTDMSEMFWECRKLEQLDVSAFNTAGVTTMEYMFGYCRQLLSLDLRNFDTSAVTNMNMLVGGCTQLVSVDVSSFDTARVTDAEYMFGNCYQLTELDLSSFDTSCMTMINGMFYKSQKLTRIYVSERWNVEQAEKVNSTNLFYQCKALVGGNGTAYDENHYGIEYAHIDAPDSPGYLSYKKYEPAGKQPERGDVNGDGAVSIDDAQLALKAYTEKIAGKDPGLTADQIKAADISGDSDLTVEDAQYILIYYTEKNVAGKNITWDDIIKK